MYSIMIVNLNIPWYSCFVKPGTVQTLFLVNVLFITFSSIHTSFIKGSNVAPTVYLRSLSLIGTVEQIFIRDTFC